MTPRQTAWATAAITTIVLVVAIVAGVTVLNFFVGAPVYMANLVAWTAAFIVGRKVGQLLGEDLNALDERAERDR
jgi:hypothetical protein